MKKINTTFYYSFKRSVRPTRKQSGAISLVTAITLPVVAGVLALAIDISFALAERNAMQSAADSAARAGAQIKSVEGATLEQIQAEVWAITKANGFEHNPNENSPNYTNVIVNYKPTTGNYTTAPNALEVLIFKRSTPIFGAAMNLFAGNKGVRAVGNWDFSPCLVALNTSSTGAATGISIAGGTDLTANCAVYSNSPSASASVTAQGGSFLRYTNLYMAGNTTSGGVLPFDGSSQVFPDSSAIANPFKRVVAQIPTVQPSSGAPTRVVYTASYNANAANPGSVTPACSVPLSDQKLAATKTTTQGFDSTNSTLYLAPGYYANGINVTSNICGPTTTVTNVKLLDGTYYLDGSGFTHTATSVDGSSVNMVLMNNAIFDSAGANLTLGPYSAGAFPGITVIGNGSKNGFIGFTSSTGGTAAYKVSITGNFVLPNFDVKVAGNVTFIKQCLTLIANSLNLNASGEIGGGCTSFLLGSAAVPGFKLVE